MVNFCVPNSNQIAFFKLENGLDSLSTFAEDTVITGLIIICLNSSVVGPPIPSMMSS